LPQQPNSDNTKASAPAPSQAAIEPEDKAIFLLKTWAQHMVFDPKEFEDVSASLVPTAVSQLK
jgi:hypothetical protein